VKGSLLAEGQNFNMNLL